MCKCFISSFMLVMDVLCCVNLERILILAKLGVCCCEDISDLNMYRVYTKEWCGFKS